MFRAIADSKCPDCRVRSADHEAVPGRLSQQAAVVIAPNTGVEIGAARRRRIADRSPSTLLGHVAWKGPKRHHNVTHTYRSPSYPDLEMTCPKQGRSIPRIQKGKNANE